MAEAPAKSLTGSAGIRMIILPPTEPGQTTEIMGQDHGYLSSAYLQLFQDLACKKGSHPVGPV